MKAQTSKHVDVEVLGRREVDVGEEARGRGGLDLVDRARGGSARRGAGRASARPPAGSRCRRAKSSEAGCAASARTAAAASRRICRTQCAVVEKRDVLRPRHADHHLQPVPRGLVEQRLGGHGVGANRVDAGGGHQREVARDLCRGGKLAPSASGANVPYATPLTRKRRPSTSRNLPEFNNLLLSCRPVTQPSRLLGHCPRRGRAARARLSAPPRYARADVRSDARHCRRLCCQVFVNSAIACTGSRRACPTRSSGRGRTGMATAWGTWCCT